MTDPTSQQYVALPGSERELVPGARVVGPVDANEVIQLTIKVRPRSSADDLAKEADALGSLPPNQRTYLTSEEYESKYGADPADVQRIVEFAEQHHLQVLVSDLSQRTIAVSGTAQQIADTFRVKLMQYESPQGAYRGRLGPVYVPSDLQPLIEGIFGLDNRQQAHRQVSSTSGDAEKTP
jgi:kumamolisin